MSRSCLSFIIGAGLIFFTHLASAQSPSTKPNTPAKTVSGGTKSDAKAEADRIARERRMEARSLLISLASDARSFRDQVLRARSLARIADALWSVDPDQARVLFRQAWEAAETVYRETQLNIRREVLTLAARRDRALAEEFLQKLKTDQQQAGVEDSSPDLWGLPDYSQQRLNLAEELLQSGDVERALQFATPVLSNVTISTLDFLTYLRAKDPAAADQRYASMLANVRNAAADANTISLLSSYIFTPHTYVIFNGGAAESAWPVSPSPPANVSAQLRLAFFQSASAALLRAQPSPGEDQITSGLMEKYMVMKRLLPLFEQYAPKELTEAMRGQFTALNSQIRDDVREAQNERAQKEIGPEKSSVDREQSLLDQIEHARTSQERDDLYFRVALLALSRDDPKAREYVNAIEESEFRKQVQTWVDWTLAGTAIKNKKTETALEVARTAPLSHIQRVWILTQAAKLLAKTDHDQALSLVEEATGEVRRIDGGDPDRPRGFLAVANALNVVAPSRVWEAVFDAVKAANSADNFKGEDAELTLAIRSKDLILQKHDAVSDFDLEGIFQEIANNDLQRSLQLARGFREEAPRANATIAICQSVLTSPTATRN